MKNHLYVKFVHSGVITTALFLFLFFSNVYAQHYTEITTSNGEHIRLDNPNGTVYSVLSKDGKIQSVQSLNPDEVVRLIVTFKDPPLAVYQINKSSLQRSSLSSVYTTLQASHESFRTALNNIQLQLSTQLKSDYSYIIKRDYYRALNGVALECKRGMISKIRALPMVKYVSMDREVKANLTQSVHQIRADIVQDSLGITGDGVLVGDVDTGIDYNNPALGGGFGPAFRVIGGYDFANNDNDPMDDHGHGTHVAGIIGANGDTLRGVAPDVNFLAVKVLDAYGSGYESNVIAGIDYCLDPDGNPETDDAVDIINMSLGGEPSIDNPVDSAVDNATTAGVLCVVAAGNDGYGRYGTINSPGTSESALTVGACDSVNQIVYFSSMGPDPIHSSIKPEVVAPGFHILSTILNNQTASWSGTSMAAPHVTGTAALIKQEHSLWTPGEIKAAIINSAHSAGDTVSIFAQGKGIVDALDAVKTSLVVEPGIMSFGYVDLEQDVWKDTLNLTVRNFRSVTQHVQVSIIDEPPSGATLTFDKTSFSLAPGEEMSIQAILTVPSSVPVVSTEPFMYLGKFEVTSDSDNVTVPFSFMKSTTLVITLDLPPDYLYLLDRVHATIEEVDLQGATKYIIPVSEGYSLDLLAIMRADTPAVNNFNLYIVHHMINDPTGLTYILVNHEEASINMIGDTVYDINSNKINIDTAAYDINYQIILHNMQSEASVGVLFIGFQPYNNRLFTNPVDSAFFIVKQTAVLDNKEIIWLKKFNNGIKNRQDIEFPSGPDNLVRFNFKSAYHNPVVSDTALCVKHFYVNSKLWQPSSFLGDYWGFSLSDGEFYSNKQDIKNNPKMYTSTYLGFAYDTVTSFVNRFPYPRPMLCTPEFTINNNNEAVFEKVNILPYNLSREFVVGILKPGDTINVEDNVHFHFPNFTTHVAGDFLYMAKHNEISYTSDLQRDGDGGTIYSNGLYEEATYLSHYWNLPRFTVQAFAHNRSQKNVKPYKLWDWMTFQGSFDDYLYAYYVFNNVQKNAGIYRILSNTYPYKLLGQAGQCTLDFEYQIPSFKKFFPSFSFLQVSVDDRAVDVVQPDQNGKIRLVIFDPDSSVTSADISLLLASGDEINLPVSFIGENEYDALIPSYIPKGFIDVVVRIQDTDGNKCELTASPGFYFGNTSDNIKLDARLRMTSYTLDNVEDINMEAGDTLNYTLSYTNFGSDTARNVVVTFPATPYFIPIGSSTWTIDSLNVNDTVKVSVSLLFLGKQQSTEKYTHYSPTVMWSSDETNYLRKYNVFVDFQNTVTGVSQTVSTIPSRFELYQNYPNPFNPSTTIKYDLPKQSRVKIEVYDILGRKVATLVDETRIAGSYQVIWNANRSASGVYFYRIETGNYCATKKLLLLK